MPKEFQDRQCRPTLIYAAAALFGAFPAADGVLVARSARRVVESWPGARTLIAMALVDCGIEAKKQDATERRDDLLDELRTLAQSHPDDPAVREWLAMGLFSALNYAKQEDDLARRDALFEELRDLAVRFSESEIVQEAWRRAHALAN